MSIALVVLTDGRDDYLGETMAHLERNLLGADALVTERWLFDDEGSWEHMATLRGWYPHFTIVSAGQRLGFGGAYANMWHTLATQSEATWVVAWEDDFVATRPVPLADMIALSEEQPHLAQVALRRQAWNADERAAGGFIEAAPGWYHEMANGPRRWVETTRNYTTNPSLYRRQLCEVGWPTVPQSEGRLGFLLREHGLPWGIPGDAVRFGFLGGLDDGREWVRHIGEHRAGTGY